MIKKSVEQIAEDIQKVLLEPRVIELTHGKDYWIKKCENGGISISKGIAAHISIKLMHYKHRTGVK